MEDRDPVLLSDPTILEYDQATPHILTDTPYLGQSLTRTAKLWRQLYPGATQQQRIDLMLLIGRELGVEACECIRG